VTNDFGKVMSIARKFGIRSKKSVAGQLAYE
jgi:hypothetical protein